MTKRLPYLFILALVISCSQNLWIANGLLRPKKPKFSILKEPFVSNTLVDTEHIYISTKRFINYDSNRIISSYGFYADGRFIMNSFYESNIDSFIYTRTTWDSSSRIGYYTTKGGIIKSQYFEQYGGGEYINMEGQIKVDTIIFAEKFLMLSLKREIRYDTIIKSSYPLK